MNRGFSRLDRRVQKWVYQQGWTNLRDIQEKAIDPILEGQQDVVISASTASGKTEAFFLPACSAVVDENDGFSILYISPLKALINDQYRRLEGLCKTLDMVLTPWHGDSTQSKKRRVKQEPSGILLITPESLESLLIREAGWVKHAFSSLRYVVIDEFHAFIGTERGHHLLSLLNRLEILLDRKQSPIPRTALSATLGEVERVPRMLRPDASLPCRIIIGDTPGSGLKMQIRGYVETAKEGSATAEDRICRELYELCRGDSHLIFANSRQRTEGVAAKLSDLCEKNQVPNEFFPHHGSLAKEFRETLESRLQEERLPTTAVCTMTLELGIDIGKVHSVIQVTAPHSVASLRQRLGRSGRRGAPSVLRMMIAENGLTASSTVIDQLRMELLQSIAMVRLLVVDKWFEPADTDQCHFSTLFHQILAVIAQRGGVRPDQLFTMLCKEGPFIKVTVAHFKTLLVHMGQKEMISQLSNGELVLGVAGETLVDHYTFYAVFKTPEEFRIVAEGRTLGTLPVGSPVVEGQHIVFGGRRWKIHEIDGEKSVIYVEATKGGKPPRFAGQGIFIHDRIRREMYRILCAGDYRIFSGDTAIDFLDDKAKSLFEEAHRSFTEMSLEKEWVIASGKKIYLFPWLGDKAAHTLGVMLLQSGFKVNVFAGVIEISDAEIGDVVNVCKSYAAGDTPTRESLAETVPNKFLDKYDDRLPEELLSYGYGMKVFDVEKVILWLKGLFTHSTNDHFNQPWTT